MLGRRTPTGWACGRHGHDACRSGATILAARTTSTFTFRRHGRRSVRCCAEHTAAAIHHSKMDVRRPNETGFCCNATAPYVLLITIAGSHCQQQPVLERLPAAAHAAVASRTPRARDVVTAAAATCSARRPECECHTRQTDRDAHRVPCPAERQWHRAQVGGCADAACSRGPVRHTRQWPRDRHDAAPARSRAARTPGIPRGHAEPGCTAGNGPTRSARG